MAAISAYFGAQPAALDTLTRALAVRGGEPNTWNADQPPLGLGLRAAVPEIRTSKNVAIVIDGIAEATTLLGRYAQEGSRALLVGTDPYVVALADPDAGQLVLARNGDGPPLYYAVHRDTVLAASEPTALIAAGLPGAPDPATVERFLAGGACDDTEATFFAGIRRVLPGQVVTITKGGIATVTVKPTPQLAVAPAAAALRAAVRSGRVGVRLSEGVAGAAVLAEALGAGVRNVYSTSFAPVDSGEEAYAARLLTPLEDQLTHTVVPAGPEDLERDLDAFLLDLGEPVPDPTGYLLWATARAAAGEIDALVDPVGAHLLLAAGDRMPPNSQRHTATAYLSRVADRTAIRFGVALRLPYTEAVGAGDPLRKELAALARAAELTGADQLRMPAPTRELLLGLRGRVYAALLTERFAGRSWADQRTALAGFQGLLRGRRTDADLFWRLYLVERWLHVIFDQAAKPTAPRGAFEPHPGRALEAGGWARHPIRTAVLAPGDKLAEQLRWYVTEFTHQLAADKVHSKALARPWYVVVAAKPVAVAQGRARFLWEITPSLSARVLTVRGDGVRRGPWRTQLAIEASGLGRVVCAGGLLATGMRSLAYKVGGPALRGVTVPREKAVYPANVAVIPPPEDPDQVAAALREALRTGLPAEAYATLAGCAVVAGTQVLGWAGDGDFPVEALAGDPLGGAGEQTPIAVVSRALGGKPPKKDKARRRVPSGARR